jgi:hypothetical protein
MSRRGLTAQQTLDLSNAVAHLPVPDQEAFFARASGLVK